MNRPDPITQEVIRGRLMSIAREMGTVTIRSGRSILIRENEDCSAAILDENCEIIAQDVHCAGHLGSIPLAARACVEEIGRDNLEPGDVLLQNDPYRGCIHLPDLCLVMPVFDGKKPVFYVSNIAHHSDVGGMVPGSCAANAREIYQEGIRMPPLKIVEKGRLNKQVMDVFLSNVRIADERYGDLQAQISALAIGSRRIRGLLDKYGVQTVRSHVKSILSHSEALTRAEFAGFPSGDYYFEDYLDDDGLSGAPKKIAVTIRVGDGDLTFDFTGTDPQADGAVNSSLAVTYASVYYMVRAITDPTIPVNGGCYRMIKLVTPEGSIVNPSPPAAVAACSEVYPRIIDVLLGAFAECVPDRVVAAPMGTNNIHIIAGYDTQRERPFLYYECYGGGWGAGPDYDGISGYDCFETNARATSVEVLESQYPFHLQEAKYRCGSGGAGKWQGGRGVYRRLKVNEDVVFSLVADRFKRTPFGLAGGASGAGGAVTVRLPDGKEQEVYSKVAGLRIPAGSEIVTMTGGGGGYGDPLERCPQQVADDVKEGRISLQTARQAYGVVLNSAGYEISKEETVVLRQRMKEDGLNGRG